MIPQELLDLAAQGEAEFAKRQAEAEAAELRQAEAEMAKQRQCFESLKSAAFSQLPAAIQSYIDWTEIEPTSEHPFYTTVSWCTLNLRVEDWEPIQVSFFQRDGIWTLKGWATPYESNKYYHVAAYQPVNFDRPYEDGENAEAYVSKDDRHDWQVDSIACALAAARHQGQLHTQLQAQAAEINARRQAEKQKEAEARQIEQAHAAANGHEPEPLPAPTQDEILLSTLKEWLRGELTNLIG